MGRGVATEPAKGVYKHKQANVVSCLRAGPRRRRIWLVLLAVFLVWAMLPSVPFNPPRWFLATLLMPSFYAEPDVLNYVDPLIGTTNGGHVFPGATLPYGMAKVVADVDNGAENAAGFVSDSSLIRGLSHLHDSGTGGAASLGNFPIFVHPGCPNDIFAQCEFDATRRAVSRVNDSVRAQPGYFSIRLNNSVSVEVTTTHRAALHRFSFSQEEEIESRGRSVRNSPLILLDLVDLGNTRLFGDMSVEPSTGRMLGNASFIPSFGEGNYAAFICADFRGAEIRNSGIFTPRGVNNETKEMGDSITGAHIPMGSAGLWVQFNKPPRGQILARVGLSFVSAEKACQTAEEEIPNFEFDPVVQNSRKAWRDKLSVVEVDSQGIREDLLTTFWSGIYRTMLSPQDYTGENARWKSDEPYFDSFYCIWDSFRAQHPLLTIIDPQTQLKMVRSLVDIYKHEGKLPDCRMSFSKGYTQGGSNADVVLADAFLKNLTAGVDWSLAYEAVVSDAELEPKNWAVEGRGNLESWKKLGYIPSDDVDKNGTGPMSRSISRTVEYAYDDFSVGMIARGLGKADDARKYFERSRNWANMFDASALDRQSDGSDAPPQSDFVGFPQPRKVNGEFVFHPTRLCSPVYEQHKCYLDTAYATYEGSPWLYQFFVPHDMPSLIAKLGGKQLFVERLDYFHSSGIAYMGNEQSFLPVFQFHYGGRPALSSYWVHQYIPRQFNSSINGIPGNDDCAMGAFTAFALMGFFPVAGQSVYLLTAPFFREVRLHTPSGRLAIIRNIGFDPNYEAIYIQSARLNGKPYARNWISHDFFLHGGVLELVLGKKESHWGVMDEDLPPSLSAGTL